MQEDSFIVGLDIGTTKICAIVGRKDEFGKLEVLGMGKAKSDGVIRGIVTNIDKTVHAIRKAIKEAEDQAGVDVGVVNVGIAGQHIHSQIQHGSITRDPGGDEITKDDVNRLTNDMFRLVIDPGSDIIHVMPQHYTVDNEEGIIDPVGMSGVKLEADFHVITAQTNAIKNVNRCVKKSEREVQELILEPLASSLAVLSEEEKEAGVCLVDIGGGTTDIAIFHDNIIRHTAVIPFGGNSITTDIKTGCSVMQDQAEKLKVNFGKAIAELANENEIVSIPGLRDRPPKEISVKNLAHIIEARLEEIIEMVHAEIISVGYDDVLSAGIVVTGGGSQMQHLKELFEFMTGMDTRIGYPNEHLGKSKMSEMNNPVFATSVGLVLSGFLAIDERNRWMKQENEETTGTNESKKEKKGMSVFQKVLARTKSVIIDEYKH